ncbi:hypothetical protein RJ640_017530 [Escallonia rubra]|uniref:BHLH domain-containing protein n=1 Tax=Escallonia rubra TaxID=112253 RepID=A0AA88RBI9_9ASTE|nr:hypothetical protein RJ640_017530 [Escallonia rubra]
MEFVDTALDDFCMAEEETSAGRMGRRRHIGDETGEFKSKNLHAERRRREKLSGRLLELRSQVPIITNMNKATIITDAITYIKELQKCVEDLSNQLHEMEAATEEEPATKSYEIDDTKDQMNQWEIEPEVKVIQVDGSKLWIKIVFQKKRGGFTKLMEAMNVLGCDITDTSLTTSKGAFLFTSSVEVISKVQKFSR